ncbi:carbohydrate ABC transporter permease [Cellulomonas oligotrophica]|uniref:N,N'-diacetylchitobiose transport system permease protein n=1 Tax=Cellulomonas oligotrophica TaxID=931536 RepID=A0A7Y9FIS3_9CELL|nr:N,N'-diacetylchitobiose transport system permease protein [Cellulomonas oligotrophica]GIG32879.1 sugar ABC transporter permease [Cellulomonas oligotrophica]
MSLAPAAPVATAAARALRPAPPGAVRRPPLRRRAATWGWGLVALVVSAAFAFPVYWMLNTSLLPTDEIIGPRLHLWPDEPTLRNYGTAIFEQERSPFLPALGNSLTVTFGVLVASMLCAFVGALAVTRFRFRGRRAFVLSILVVQMIPGEAMMISVFQLVDGWRLLNTVLGLGLVYLAGVLPFTIWTLRGFVAGVPVELEEAAMIDGCSRGRAFWAITFPLLAPGLVATGVFAFLQAWNEFMMALIIMQRPESMTLPVWLRTFQQATRATDWGALMAGSVLVAVPVIVFFLLVQGRMTGGLVSGAVKG